MFKPINYITLIIFTNFIFLINTSAQGLFLNININECRSCYAGIEYLHPKQTNISSFIVFKEKYKADSLDLEEQFKFSNRGFHLLFNNFLYNKFNFSEEKSSVSYYDINGNIICNKNLKELSIDFVKDSIINKHIIGTYEKKMIIRKYANNKIYAFNLPTGVLTITDRESNHVQQIRSKYFEFDKLYKNLLAEEKDLHFSSEILNKQSTNYTPSYKWFDIDKYGNVYMLYAYMCFEDSNKVDASEKFCIAKFSERLELLNVFPIEEINERGIFNYMFILKDSTSIILNVHDVNEWISEKVKNNDKPIYVLSEFKLKSNRFIFSKYFDFDLPYIYRNKLHENYLSLNYSFYPFISYMYANEIYNASNSKLVNIIDTEKYLKLTNNINDIKFKLLLIANDEREGTFYTFYKIMEDLYLNVYDSEMNRISTSKINKQLVNLESFLFMEYDTDKNSIYFYYDNPEKYEVYPIEFFK